MRLFAARESHGHPAPRAREPGHDLHVCQGRLDCGTWWRSYGRLAKLKILAGDIGGTKTNMGLFRMEEGVLNKEPSRIITYASKEYRGLPEIIQAWLEKNSDISAKNIDIACFGVAGPVIKNSIKATNLPWELVTGGEVAQKTGMTRVILINDLVAMASGVNDLTEGDLKTLHAGAKGAPGSNCVVLAAGTGLDMVLLPGGKKGCPPIASEGSHMDFAPRNDEEMRLFDFLQHKDFIQKESGGHLSIERVVSGVGLKSIYDCLVEQGSGSTGKDQDVMREITCSADPPRDISKAAIEGRSPLCTQALKMFAAAYGAAAGNLALVATARGGVYLGGGIAPRIFKQLKAIDDAFVKAFLDKGRFRSFLEEVPIRVIQNTQAAMLGAACYASLHHDKPDFSSSPTIY